MAMMSSTDWRAASSSDRLVGVWRTEADGAAAQAGVAGR